MKTSLTKSEKVIALTAAVAISVFFIAFLKVNRSTPNSPQIETGSGINYTMARPEAAYSEYNLDGREIDQSYEGLEVERGLAKLDQKKKDLIAKKVAETKKKDEAKKKQSQAEKDKQKTQQQARFAEQKIQEKKAVAAQDRNNTAREQKQVASYYNSPGAVQNSNTNNEETEEVQKTKKKTFAEWRALLFAKPTNENMVLFITAFKKNEVTATEFQAMAQDLIEQNDQHLKGLGLLALRSVPSLTSLSQLAHVDYANLGNLRSYVDNSLNAYLQTQNLPFLNQALMTKDKVLIVKTLNLLNTNLAKFGQGDFSSLVDPRNRREGEVGSFSLANYRLLLPALTQLSTSQDPDVASLAHQATSYIQTSNNVAQVRF